MGTGMLEINSMISVWNSTYCLISAMIILPNVFPLTTGVTLSAVSSQSFDDEVCSVVASFFFF